MGDDDLGKRVFKCGFISELVEYLNRKSSSNAATYPILRAYYDCRANGISLAPR